MGNQKIYYLQSKIAYFLRSFIVISPIFVQFLVTLIPAYESFRVPLSDMVTSIAFYGICYYFYGIFLCTRAGEVQSLGRSGFQDVKFFFSVAFYIIFVMNNSFRENLFLQFDDTVSLNDKLLSVSYAFGILVILIAVFIMVLYRILPMLGQSVIEVEE